MTTPNFDNLPDIYDRLYDIAAQDKPFRTSEVDTVVLTKTLGISDNKDMSDLFELDDEQRDKIMDEFDTSASLEYSFSAERVTGVCGVPFFNYVVTTSLEQGVSRIPIGFTERISRKKLAKVERDRHLFLSAMLSQAFYINTDCYGFVATNDSYVLRHRGKTLAYTDSEIFTESGCEGDMVKLPAGETLGDASIKNYGFIPASIHHERLPEADRIELELAFRALGLASPDDDQDEADALFNARCHQIHAVLDLMQATRPLTL